MFLQGFILCQYRMIVRCVRYLPKVTRAGKNTSMELPGIVGDETSRLGQSWKSWARPSAPRTVTLACSLQPAPTTPPAPGWYQNVQTRIFLVPLNQGSW